MPKVTTYLIFTHVYKIGIYYSRLLHSISIPASSLLLCTTFMKFINKWPPGNAILSETNQDFENDPL